MRHLAFLPPLAPLKTRKGIVPVFTIPCLGGLMWILHFILEFSALSAADMSLYFILYHLGAVPVGVAVHLLWVSKLGKTQEWVFYSATLLAVLSLIALLFVSEELLILFLLALAGFTIGIVLPYLHYLASAFLHNTEYNGRLNSMVYVGISIIVLIDAVLDFYQLRVLNALFLVGILLVILISFRIGKDADLLSPRNPGFRRYIGKKETYPFLMFIFFCGFFFSNTYYAATIILERSDLSYSFSKALALFAFVLFLTVLIVLPAGGLLMDSIGRRSSVLIGLYFYALAFFALTLLPNWGIDEEIVTLFIFPIIIGIGFSLALFSGILLIYELAPKEYLRIHLCISWISYGIGLVIGVITDQALLPIIEDREPLLLPVTLIIAFFTATLLVLQLDEPLPPKAELEWRRKAEHLLVLSQAGLPLYSQALQPTTVSPSQTKGKSDVALVGGALVGISSLIQEISQASSRLKVIQQENYCIMLEQGQQ
ncbi:MAG: MFS transporter, partial [Candidatus Hodarchaeales archaeon]